MRNLSRDICPFYLKFIHRWLAVGSRMAKMHQDDSTCPTCCVETEDHRHFLLCSHASQSQWGHATTTGLDTLLKQHSTDPDLRAMIVHGIDELLSTPNYTCATLLNPRLHRLAQRQNKIGWSQWLNCRVSTDWAACQDFYLKATKQYNHRKRTGRLWIQRIFDFLIRRLHIL